MEAESHRGSDAWASWIAFGGLMLILIGVFDVIGGLAALFNETYFVSAGGNLIVFDYTVWGIAMIAFGVLLAAAGVGLLNGRGWARVFAIVLVFLNATSHIAFFSAHPIWSTLMIAFNIFILYALTVRWDAAQRAL